jgi:16S rRNA (cytidine1402-2'-O)-methyltransferase
MPQAANRAAGGRLYVVATPLGNLADVTHRALKVLGSVDVVAAENMGRTKKLLSHYGLSAKVVSYREQNRRAQGRRLIEILGDGRDVALVTDAGTPGVSDPGTDLVGRAHQAGIRVVPVPGPSSVSAAVSVAGFDGAQYVFIGFLPAKASARRRLLTQWVFCPWPLVFFVPPHKAAATAADLLAVLGDREVVVAREMTKVHEEVVRLSLAELADRTGSGGAVGEWTLVVAGCPEGQVTGEADRAGAEPPGDQDILAALDRHSELPPGRRAREVAGELGVSRDRVYRLLVERPS